jgi:hypothetical protein
LAIIHLRIGSSYHHGGVRQLSSSHSTVRSAPRAAAILFRWPVAASRLMRFFRTAFLGLTPQAMNMPPLRGSENAAGGVVEHRLVTA